MKYLLCGLIVVLGVRSFAKDSPKRKPGSDDLAAGTVSQVQLCDGTEAFGSEGQGVAVSAFLNYSFEKNYQTNATEKKCEIGLAFSFEYGSDRGFPLGRLTPYNVYPVSHGKTVCTVTEENGEIFMTLSRAPGKNAKPGRPLKVLVERCKLSASGT